MHHTQIDIGWVVGVGFSEHAQEVRKSGPYFEVIKESVHEQLTDNGPHGQPRMSNEKNWITTQLINKHEGKNITLRVAVLFVIH